MARLIRPFGASASAAILALLLMLSPASVAASPWLLGPIDLPPIGTADSYSTPYETRLDVDKPGVLANDIDLDSAVLFAHLVSGPAHGILELREEGRIRYEPDPGFSGVDTFRYRPYDGVSEALLAVTVSITVAAPIPTPTPTPKPTPTPTPTPTPLPLVSLPPLPLPTSSPIPGIPSPVVPPASARTTPSAGPTAGTSGGPDPSPISSAEPGAAGVVTGGGGPSAPGRPGLAPIVPLLQEPDDGPVSFGSLGDIGMGIEWIVPSVLITVPGFLLIVIGLAQVFGGFVWLPLARRWLRGDGHRPSADATRFPN